MTTRIVLLGGGYTGVWACRQLRRRLRRELAAGTVEITLVAKESVHAYHGWSAEVISGRVPLEHTLTPLSDILGDSGVRIVQGVVQQLDPQARIVIVGTDEGAVELGYDHVLLGLGSTDPLDRLPGLVEHGRRLKDLGELDRLRADLEHRLSADGSPFRVAVLGGGPSGVETAAAVAELARSAGAADRGRAVEVLLYQGPSEVLPSLRPRYARAARWCERRLALQGVGVRTGTRVDRIVPGGFVTSQEEVVPADVVVVTGGVSFPGVPGSQALPRTERGRLRATATLQVEGWPTVWAGGDQAAVRRPLRREECPANALWAMKHGARAGANIARVVRGRSPRPFRFPGLGQVLGLGRWQGVTVVYGIQLTGRLGWLVRVGFLLWYMPTMAAARRLLRDLAGTVDARADLRSAQSLP